MKKIFKILTKKTILAILAIVIIGVPLLYLTVLNQKEARAWFDENWLYRAAVPITAHTNAEANVYITVTVDTATPITAGKMQSDCGDLRFIKANGEALPYYINGSPGCNNAATTIQVNFDDFPAGAQTIYYYYGNPSAPNGFSSAAFSTEATGATVGTLGSETQGPGPVGYWKFDDGQGSTAQDSSSSNRDGAITNAVWQTEDRCVSGKCLYFDGSGDYVDVGNNSVYNFTSENFTLEAWVRPNILNANHRVTARGHYQTDGYLLIVAADGSVYLETNQSSASQQTSTAAGVVTVNNWYHIVAQRSGSAVKIFVNGVDKTSSAGTHTNPATSTRKLTIGIHSDESTAPFKGFIDDVKIYPYARTAAQIKTDYLSGAKNAAANSGASAVLGSKPTEYLSEGLVGYWKMDDAGIDAEGETSTDSSGNSNTGTLYGDNSTGDNGTGLDCTAAAKFGTGCNLDGTDDYVDAGDPSSGVLDMGTGSLTLSAWIKTSGTNQVIIVDKQGNSDWAGYKFGVSSSGGFCAVGQLFAKIDDGTNAGTMSCSSQAVNDNAWHHVLFVVDRTTNVQKIYVDGAIGDTDTVTTTGSTSNTQAFRIGRDSASNNMYFNGLLDEARVYNRALSLKEISDLYNWAPGPVGYWDFEENSGTAAKDKSTNANTGTISGATWKPGKYGSGLKFDGSNDYVDAGTGSSLRGFENHITTEAWIKIDSFKNEFDVIAGRTVTNGATPTEYPLVIGLMNGQASARVYYDAVYEAKWTTTLTPGVWYHIAGTFDQSLSSNNIKLYVNGVLQAQTTLTQSIQSNNRNFTIGDRTASADYPFAGTIDEVKVYSYPRTQKQIVEDMNGGHPAVGSPVGSAIGHWKFDEGQGTTANDSSINANSLTLSTASWTDSGKFNKAWNGTGALWLSKADDADFDFAAADSFAVSLWYKTDSATNPSATEYLVDKGPIKASSAGYAVYANTDGTVCFGIDDDTTWNPDVSSCTSTDVYDNSWHNLIAVRDVAQDKTYIYIDGVLKDSDTDSTSATLENSQILYLGDSNGADGGDEFNGDLDEVKIYRYALTADEVKLDYNRSSSLVLGSLGDNSTYQKNAANQEYCVPGDTTSCAAPVGRWDFEEGNGGTVNDTSGNANTGTWNGTGSTHWTTGKIGKGGNFNGTDDYVGAGTDSSLRMTTNDYTMEAWIKSNSTEYQFVAGIMQANASTYELHIRDGNIIRWRTDDSGSSPTSREVSATFTYNDGKWHHIAATRVGAVGNIYVDGVFRNTGTLHATDVTANTGNAFNIGERADGGWNFNGQIDQVRVFNYARTAAQIAYDYNRGAPVGHWKLDECQGNKANDSSGNGNHGTITIGASGEDTLGTCTTSSTAWGSGATGKRNVSLSFDGDDDYVNIADNDIFDPGTGSISFGAWVKAPDANQASYIVSKRKNTADYDQWGIGFANGLSGYGAGKKLFCSFGVDNGNFHDLASTADIIDGNWHHVLCVVNYNSSLTLYVDGKAVSTSDIRNESWASVSSSQPVNIGYGNGWGYFDGQIDDVKVFNYALTAAQVKDIYNGGAVFFGPTTGSP